MGLSGRWESSGAVAAAMEEIVTYGLPDNYFDTYAQRIRAVTPDMALEAGHKLVPAQNFAWVVVGDRGRDRSRPPRARDRSAHRQRRW